MSKIQFLVDNFPNVDWNYEWYAGMYFSEGSFPPLMHYLAGAMVGWLHLSPADSLIVIAALSFVVIGGALYGLVRMVTGSRLAGLVAAMLLVGCSAYWSYVLVGGLYPRILGMAFFTLFAFLVVLHHRKPGRGPFIGMVLSLAGVLCTHLLLGAIAVAFALGLIAMLPVSARARAVQAGKLMALTALVVAFFYVPYVAGLSRAQPVPTFTRDYSPVAPGSLVAGAESLPWLLLVLVALAPAAALIGRDRRPSSLELRLMILAAAAALACLAYALAGLGATGLYIYNFQPQQAVFFAAWFLAAFVALSMRWVARRRLVAGALGAALVVQLVLAVPGLAAMTVNGDNPAKHRLQDALAVDPGQRDFRVGVSWDAASDWINSRYAVPQTRGYQQQGVVSGEWQYWFESSVWSHAPNYDEADFLLDWYGVKQFYSGPDPVAAQRFSASPDRYAATNQDTFTYLNASPILTARSTRTALVIADSASYGLVLRAIALSGFDSRSLIPIRGGQYIDDYSAADLDRFDLVVLYGYRFHDEAKAFAMLDAYVRRGGGLLVEGGQPALEQASRAPSPLPGAEIGRTSVGPDWQLTRQSDAFGADVNLARFAPAVFDGGPWGLSFIPRGSIAPWAQPVLLSGGNPVLVAGTLGLGRVVWSGMNLPYHVVSTRTQEESYLLADAIAWGAPRPRLPPAWSSAFVNPEVRRVTIERPASGVLFKESWAPNWHATVNGASATIYRAGPDFMYVAIPLNTSLFAHVEFDFEHTQVEVAGDAISVVALVGLLGWPLVAWRRRRRKEAAP